MVAVWIYKTQQTQVQGSIFGKTESYHTDTNTVRSLCLEKDKMKAVVISTIHLPNTNIRFGKVEIVGTKTLLDTVVLDEGVMTGDFVLISYYTLVSSLKQPSLVKVATKIQESL